MIIQLIEAITILTIINIVSNQIHINSSIDQMMIILQQDISLINRDKFNFLFRINFRIVFINSSNRYNVFHFSSTIISVDFRKFNHKLNEISNTKINTINLDHSNRNSSSLNKLQQIETRTIRNFINLINFFLTKQQFS